MIDIKRIIMKWRKLSNCGSIYTSIAFRSKEESMLQRSLFLKASQSFCLPRSYFRSISSSPTSTTLFSSSFCHYSKASWKTKQSNRVYSVTMNQDLIFNRATTSLCSFFSTSTSNSSSSENISSDGNTWKGRLGFIGLGNMGGSMAKNLAKTNLPLSLLDYSKEKAETIRQEIIDSSDTVHIDDEKIIKVCTNAKEMAQECDIIFLSLPSEDAATSVIMNETEGILGIETLASSDSSIANMVQGVVDLDKLKVKMIIDFGTVSTRFTKEMNDLFSSYDVNYLDAPVSGGPIGAENGTLSIMIGMNGYNETVLTKKQNESFSTSALNYYYSPIETQNILHPMLHSMGSYIVYMGESGSGTATKLINQMLTGVHIVAAAEAFLLSKELGIHETKKLCQLLERSWGNSTMLQRSGTLFDEVENVQIAKKNKSREEAIDEVLAFSGAPLRNFNKDFTMISEAMETNLDHLLLLTSTTKVLMEQGKLDGYDLHDVTIVTEIIRNLKKNSTDKKE